MFVSSIEFDRSGTSRYPGEGREPSLHAARVTLADTKPIARRLTAGVAPGNL